MTVLWRRRLIFLPALLLALVITGGVFVSVKPTYSAETILLLVPPHLSVGSKLPPSPFQGYDNLNTVAAIVSSAESSQARAALLKDKFQIPDTGYTVTPDPTGDTPEIIVTATSDVPATAMSWDRFVAADVVSYVYNFQASSSSSASPSTFVDARYLARPAKALKSDKSRLRVGIAVGVVTLMLAISVTLIFDSTMEQRSLRRRRTTLPAVTQTTDGEFYTGSSIATMHGSESRGRTSALKRP